MPSKTLIHIVALFLACAPALHGGDTNDKIDMSPFVVTSTDAGYEPDDGFSSTLLAMNEPVLTATGKGKDYYALRILYVPELAGWPVAVRIEKNGAQITRRVVKLRAVNSSSGQKIQEQKSESISAATLEKIQNELKNAGFDTLPLHDDVCGLDGNEFLIERIEDGKHTVFTRWTPEADTARRHLTRIFALADRLFQEAGFWEKNDLPEQIPLLEKLIVRKIDFVVPDKTSDAENALSERFFNKPEERAFKDVTSKNWRDKWCFFTDTLIAKAEHEKLDNASLRRCLKALNYGRNLQTAAIPSFPSLLSSGPLPDASEAEIKAYEEKYKADKVAFELAMKEREKNPDPYYDNSLAIIPVGAYLARYAKGDCWIIVCKWTSVPEKDEYISEPQKLGHIMVWAMDAQTAKVVIYVTCD